MIEGTVGEGLYLGRWNGCKCVCACSVWFFMVFVIGVCWGEGYIGLNFDGEDGEGGCEC